MPTPTWPSLLTTAKHTPRISTSAKPDLPSPEQQTLLASLRASPLTHPAPESQSQLAAAIADILSEYEDEDEDENADSSENENENETATGTGTGTGTSKEQWENLHAFLAFITKEGIVGLEDVGIHILRIALERGEDHHHHHPHHHHQASAGEKRAVFVSCAAIWALVMGEELWERRHEAEEVPVGLSLSPRSSVAVQDHGQDQGQEGQATVSKSRWQMWIDRFQFLSLTEDLDIKTRELAAEAAAVMRRVT